MQPKIRTENPADGPAVSAVIRQAFGGDDEVRLVERLRDGGWTRLALVAELDRQIVGHLLFSELSIVTSSGTVTALALAPLAVLPEYQSQGIGTALTHHGLDLCRQQGHAIVIVLGHPHYYPRFGFSAQLARPLDTPYAGDSFMALELVPGAVTGIRGRVEYPPPFSEV
jgi:putative acetyltransferase